jgi:enoyl-CoA hydratase
MKANRNSDMMNRTVVSEMDPTTGIACIRLARPHKRNAINTAMITELTGALESIRVRKDMKAVVLTGGGFFSAGGDTSGLADEEATVREMSRTTRAGEKLCAALASLPQLTIAAIEGGAIGGGISLAAFCDWRVMACTAWIWAPEAEMGLFFGWRTLPRLTALIGPARAKTIAILCRRHTAEECFTWGFGDQVVPEGQAEAQALSLAGEVAAKPKLAIALIKRSIESTASTATASDESDVMAAFMDEEGREVRGRMSRRT